MCTTGQDNIGTRCASDHVEFALSLATLLEVYQTCKHTAATGRAHCASQSIPKEYKDTVKNALAAVFAAANFSNGKEYKWVSKRFICPLQTPKI